MIAGPLITTVLDLDAALGGDAGLLLGGGLGLHLKQMHLERARERTRLPVDRWPQARATQDVDLFLRAEIVANRTQMKRYREALDSLGCTVDEQARWLKFRRSIEGMEVSVDLMVGPLGELEDRVERRNIRVRPLGSSGLHARATNDALGIEYKPLRIPIAGIRSGGTDHSCDVLVAQTFSFAIMKLCALRDRINDAESDEGRHHALDLYRIAAMLTEAEDAVARELAERYAGDAVVAEAIRVIDRLLAPRKGMGRIRLREHPLCPADADVDWLAEELRHMLLPSTGSA